MVLPAVKIRPPLETAREKSERTVLVAARPVTFEEFLQITGEDDAIELIDGVMVERMAAQLDHERLFVWMLRLMGDYVEARQLGIVLGSRTTVEINAFRGRLPDLLYVRNERLAIVQEKAVYGAPDLVVEIVSPGDQPSDLIALETDYRNIGAAEIWFIDRQRKQVLALRKRDGDYEREMLTEGVLRSEAVEGFRLSVEWLLEENPPPVSEALQQIGR
jgi:Uma2 family endonuclease